MTKQRSANIAAVAASLALMGSLAIAPMSATASSHGAKANDTVAAGKKIAFNRKKGNCLACHAMSDGVSPGDIGPPLVAMKQRFPDKAKLRAQIVDPTKANAGSRMPPFGVHKILSAKEIDSIVEFLYTL